MKLISHIKQLVTLAHLFFLPLAAFAQTNGITISNFKAAPGTGEAPTTLTFNIKWNPRSDGQVWSDTVWVFIDYNNKGTMTRLPLALSSGATLTEHSAAGQHGADIVRLEEVPGNTNGVWVVGNARTEGAFSATVQLHSTGGFETRPLHGACIYAINYPPRAQYTDDGNIKLNGTPPFYLTFDGAAATVSKSDEHGAYTYPPEGKQLTALTDASRAPGSVPECMMPAAQTLTPSAQAYCTGSGVEFALSGTHEGAVYRLIKVEGVAAATLTGTGSAATFTGTFTAGTYQAEIDSGVYCPRTLTSQVTVTEVAKPYIATVSASTICAGGSTNITATLIDNATYTWSACGATWTTSSNTTSKTCSSSYKVSVYATTHCDGSPTVADIPLTQPASAGAAPTCGCATGLVICNDMCSVSQAQESWTSKGCGKREYTTVSECGAVSMETLESSEYKTYDECCTRKSGRRTAQNSDAANENDCKSYCKLNNYVYAGWIKTDTAIMCYYYEKTCLN